MKKLITIENIRKKDDELLEFSRLWQMPFYDGFSDEQQLFLRDLTYRRENFIQDHLDIYITKCKTIIALICRILAYVGSENEENENDENIEIVIWEFKENINYLHEKLIEANKQFIDEILDKISCCYDIKRKYSILSNDEKIRHQKEYEDFLLLFKMYIENKLNKLPETDVFNKKKLEYFQNTHNIEVYIQEVLKYYKGEATYNLHSLQFEKNKQNKLELFRMPGIGSGLSKQVFKISFTPEQMKVRKNPNQVFNTIQADRNHRLFAQPTHKGRESSMENGHHHWYEHT